MNPSRLISIPTLSFLYGMAAFPAAFAEETSSVEALAATIIEDAGTTGGLCVHLGCADGELTAELSQNGRFLVHGLSPDADQVKAARQAIGSKGMYGRASVEQGAFKRLPYTSNLANLVVVDRLPTALGQGLMLREVLRILAPGGTGYVGQRAGIQPLLTGERLSDALVEAGLRDHELRTQGGVWAKFRKPVPLSPEAWSQGTYYQDGNAVYPDRSGPFTHLQWASGPESPSERYWGAYGYQSANGRNFSISRERSAAGGPSKTVLVARDAFNGLELWKLPAERGQLLAIGDRVYAVIDGSLKAIDAASGKIVLDYKIGGKVGRLLYQDGALFLVGRGGVQALDAATGESKWKSKARSYHGIAVLGDGKLFCSGYAKPTPLTCVDLKSGEVLWSQPGSRLMQGAYLYSSGVVAASSRKGFHAFSADDGRMLWELADKENSGIEANHRKCMFFAGGLLWTQNSSGKSWIGLDIATGKEKKRLEYEKRLAAKRCSPAQATSRYFIDDSNVLLEYETGKLDHVPGARSGCSFGFLPANGMLYTVPNACTCYPMLEGFMGLAPKDWWSQDPVEPTEAGRLVKGPALGSVSPPEQGAPQDWPTFRHDGDRSGVTPESIDANLAPVWSADTGGELTAPVSAGGLVCVALPESHQVVAFQARTGTKQWSFTAGARVDGPPTIHRGLVLFGSRDGRVYCLRASDGALVWRLRAAPYERRIAAFGQLESSWPVPGSVLVHDGKIWFAAGRSSELDGGLQVYAVTPTTGEVTWQSRLHHTDFHGGIRGNNRIVLAEPPQSLGESVIMHWWKYDAKSEKEAIRKGRPWRALEDTVARGSAGLFRLRVVPTGRKTPPNYTVTGQPQGGTKWTVTFTEPLTSLIVAGDTVFVAGQTASQASPKGLLLALSVADGKELQRRELSAPPVSFGIAAAGGSLFVSTQDGRLTCLGGASR